jgi:RNA polymerase sigma factor (sigma-70 family)
VSEAAAVAGFTRLLSDERLTRRAVGGDERAFAAIFRRYHQSLYRFCLAIVGNPEDAQDALQNTMIKVLRALPGEERQIELKPWLYRIAHNESIDLLRRRRESSELDVEQVAPGYGIADDVEARERLRRLFTDLKELPERQREVLVMRELGGLDFEEIGTALETSDAVARQTLYEARQSLRQMEEGREMSCETVMRALSDGDGRVTRRRDVRAHLRSCAVCRGFRDEIKSRERDLAALSPLPAVAAAGMLQGLLGGSSAAGGGGLAAALGGGAAKTISASAAAKGVATVAAVAAVGVTAADRTGVIHIWPEDGRAKSSTPAPGGSGGAAGGEAPGVSSAHAAAGAKDGGGQGPGAGKAEGKDGAARQVLPSSSPGGSEATPSVKGEAKGHPHGGPQEGAKSHGPPEHAPAHGQEKTTPEAAAGGQETADANKPPPPEQSEGADANSGSSPKSGGQPAPSQKPSSPPAQDSGSHTPKGAPADPPAAAPPPQSQPPANEKASPGPPANPGPPPSKGKSAEKAP